LKEEGGRVKKEGMRQNMKNDLPNRTFEFAKQEKCEIKKRRSAGHNVP
jgi:hypothetical protein